MFTRHCLKLTVLTRCMVPKRLFITKTSATPQNCKKCHNLLALRSLSRTASYGVRFPHYLSQSDRTAIEKPHPKDVRTSSVTSEELLEKLIAGISGDIHQKNRAYRNDVLKVVKKVKELNFSTKRQGLLLLKCCTELLPDETPSARMALAEEIWNTLSPHTKFTIEHYNELLRVYIANNRTLNANSFVQKMAPVTPTTTTYELILRALGEVGDLNQSTEVISNMKSQGIPASESVFNSLIICQGKLGNIKNIEEVLSMMKSLKLDPSIETFTAIARALAFNKNTELVKLEIVKAEKKGLQFEENHIMEIVKTLSSVGSYDVLPEVLKHLPEKTLKSPSISPYMQSVATLLVFQNHPMAALEMYKCLPLPSFGPKDDQGLHGRSLVRDCVKASMPSSVIGLITQELMSSSRNPIALQNACQAALQLGKTPLALDLFGRMKQLGLPLRSHYFWPILVHNSKTFGEKGIMNTLQTMIQMDVKPDYETVISYVIPYVSFTSPQNLMKKFQEAGLPVSSVLTAMMETLLNSGQVRAASELCELFSGKVDAEKILQPLIKGFLISMDLTSTVYILEDLKDKASDKDKDWTGRFLCEFIQNKKVKGELVDFVNIVEEINKRSLKISAVAADFCLSNIPQKFESKKESIKNMLMEITDEKLMEESDLFTQHSIPHPRSMDEGSLRAHLNELEAKNMNTRGVLRKLLQQYCRENNLVAAKEIVSKCEKEGVFLSAGMRASIFDLYVKLGELDLAELSLSELTKTSPNFNLDEFKVIDFATLMVFKKKIDKAFDLLTEQSKKRRVMGGRKIEMNCWRLLDATASNGSPNETQKMFALLISYGYCKPNNTLLGPLIRVHLKKENLEEAVKEFSKLANKYNKTPLKHELLCKILSKMTDLQAESCFLGGEKEDNTNFSKLAQTVLNVDRKVHGASDVQLTLISAVADVGHKRTLRRLFLDPTISIHPEAILRRCERFADEKKITALENIAECGKGVRYVDTEEIYDMMLSVYQREDKYNEALVLFRRMQENDVVPSQKFLQNLASFLQANNRTVPSEILGALDIETRSKVLNE